MSSETGRHTSGTQDSPSQAVSSAGQGDKSKKSRSAPTAMLIIVAALLAIGLVLVAIFWFRGGRWVTVTTPSMGESAPVGTLLLTEPATAEALEVGDIVVFSPPSGDGRTYAHRIVELEPGQIRTKGDINGAIDPWLLGFGDIQGVVTSRLIGIGWLLHMTPILLIGWAAVYLLTRFYVRGEYKLPVLVVGSSLVLALAVWVVRPLVGASVISQSSQDGQATTVLVPTGLLDLQIEALGGSSTVLRPGEVGSVVSSYTNEQGLFISTIGPHLTFISWLVFGLIWSIPLLVCTAVALRRVDVPADASTADNPLPT